MKTDNEIIAEFMGLPLYKERPEFSGERKLKKVPFQKWQYHTSWDWLMPVVEKIYKMYKWNEFHYNPDTCYFYCTEKIKIVVNVGGGMDNGKCGSMIYKYLNSPNPIYTAVVEFIKWYNESKPQ